MQPENEPTSQTKKPSKNVIFFHLLCVTLPMVSLLLSEIISQVPVSGSVFRRTQEILQTYFPPLFPFLLLTIMKAWRHQYPKYFTNSRIPCILFFILKYIFSFPQLGYSLFSCFSFSKTSS